MTISPGTRLGRYEVRTPLGAGGMGEVYVAFDRDLGREVAIKVIRDAAPDSDRVHRFVQEAKAASALNHPNVAHVYEIGSQDGLRFIAMEIVAGETLRTRIARGPIPVDDALDIALQVTSALAAAHKAGVLHRDIKPENIMIRPDGYAKVLDFGLAKLRDPRDSATVVKTATGIAMGTVGYMAPEQLSGEHVTATADVYSLGVVIYEMIHGSRPGGSRLAIPASPKLESILKKALAQDPNDRYPSAVELHDALNEVSRAHKVPAPRSAATALTTIAVLVVLVAIGTAVWFFLRKQRENDARQSVVLAQRFYEEHKLPEAYGQAMHAAEVLPSDDRVVDIITKVTQKVSISSDPPGATVYMQRFKGPAERVRMGTTPLDLPRLLRADYIVTVEKDGFAPATRPLSIAPIWFGDTDMPRMPGTLQVKLLPSASVPPSMVFVAGGPYRLQAWYRASDREVPLGDFFIDRTEVSNADFAKFVRSGAYRQTPALSKLADTTGLPGPRSWSGGAPPAGRENYPVTDVTWDEANAFCAWTGKKLPTIFQWERAGRYPGTRGVATTFPWGMVPAGVDVTERANFLGKGTVPVDSMPFGMSTWGALHMAGNVSEWIRNVKPPGHGARGGSWNDATYAFGRTAAFPSTYSSATLGFRCVKESGGESGDFDLNEKPVSPVYKAVDDRTYEEYRKRYDYVRTPLTARIVEAVETPDWRREKIAFDVAGKTVIAYLLLPHAPYKPPYQVIFFTPPSDVENGLRSLVVSMEKKFAPHLRSGRAVFAVAMEGYIERPRTSDFQLPDTRSDEYVDYVVSRMTELRRGIDYLETRNDIDSKRIAFEADSAGVWSGVLLCAVDSRFRSVLFVGSGIRPREVSDVPAANRINFLPHITAPKFMMQGKYDESSPLTSEFEPLYRLLREPKRELLFEGPHVPPFDLFIRESQKWFDETMGPVR